MANVVVNTNGTSENAAREAWDSFLTAHPRIHGALSIVSSFFGYFLNGHAVVAFVQWLVRVAGRIAESALLLATLYVTLNNVAHTLVTWILPVSAINALNYLSLVAFSLLPELIVAAAIKITVDHWMMLARTPSWKNQAWIWAALYTLPTVIFIVMTVYTLLGFVQIIAVSGTPAQATGTALSIRFLAGWGYAMIEILFATIGKKSYVALLDRLRSMVATQGESLSSARERIATQETVANSLRATVATLEAQSATQGALLIEKESAIEALRSALTLRDSTIAEVGVALSEQDEEISELRATIAKLQKSKALRQAQSVTSVALQKAPESATQGTTHSPRSTSGNGYVAIDDGDSIALSDGQGATVIATGEPRDRIKSAMLIALRNGDKVNLREIAEAAQAGYSTVRKHAQALIEEITQEIPELKIQGE